MPDYFLPCTDRIREFFISSEELSSQDIPFLERFYARHWPALRKLKIGECEDVYLSASTRDHRFNSNIKAYLGVLDEMSWGFAGRGAYNLSLNLLYTYTVDKEFAESHANEFRKDFLENIDKKKSYVIEKSLILDWIKEKQKGISYVQ
ncbi:MAG: DUF6166 domain-containing protein [Bacteriovoracia bacterium]